MIQVIVVGIGSEEFGAVEKELDTSLRRKHFKLYRSKDESTAEVMVCYFIPEVASDTKGSDAILEALGVQILVPIGEGLLGRLSEVIIRDDSDVVELRFVDGGPSYYSLNELIRFIEGSDFSDFWTIVKRRYTMSMKLYWARIRSFLGWPGRIL